MKHLVSTRRSDEAEISVLGSMLLDDQAVDRARELLEPFDFYHPAHRLIFETIGQLRDQGWRPDPLALRDALRRAGDLEKAGGEEYLATIVEIVSTAANIEPFARTVRADASIRELAGVAGWIQEAARNGHAAEELLAESERRVFAATQRDTGVGEARLGDLLGRALGQLGSEIDDAIPTPWSDLNAVLNGGLHPGQLWIIGAPPSRGKTAMAVQIALRAAQAGSAVLFVSLEMAAEEVAQRFLSAASYLSRERVRKGAQRTSDEQQAIEAALRMLRPLPVTFATDLETIARILSRGRRFAASAKRGLVIVDYLQLVSAPGGNRTNQIGDGESRSEAPGA